MKSLSELASLFDGVRWRGKTSFQCRCPCHDDRQASLTFSDGDNGIVLYCHAGCKTEDILATVGLTYQDIMPEQTVTTPRFNFKDVVAEYYYRNGCRKLRDGSKHFTWQHQEPDGSWMPKREKAPHVLYQAGKPQQTVYVLEGEKDCNNAAAIGLFAVSAEDGAGAKSKWYNSYSEELRGKDVILIPDNDDVGRKFCEDIAAQIVSVTKSVKVIDLKKLWDKLPEKGDISDVIDYYGKDRTADLLRDLEQAAETWTPFTAEEEDVFTSFNFYSVPDLTEEERKPPEFIVDGMIPVGMTFFSGAPKTRKSFFALQIAIAVANGSKFFGFDTRQCDVCYLDLEGSKSRISSRTQRMTNAIPSNVFVTNRVQERLSNGLTKKLQALHRQRPSIRLIIIDTYSRARGSPKAFGLNAYDADVQFLEPIQQMALEENIAILFVHHDKKGAGFASDSFERLSGTMGISGSADSVLNLIADGKRFEGKAKLEYTPRDARGGELDLVFDECFMEWQTFVVPPSDLKGNPVCNWILDNVPEPKHEAIFVPYERVCYESYRMYSDSPGDIVREQIDRYRSELFAKYGIAIQTGVKSNGKRGIRLFNII